MFSVTHGSHEPTDLIFRAAEQAFVLVQLDLLRCVRSDQTFALDQPIKVGGDVCMLPFGPDSSIFICIRDLFL